MKTFYYEVTLTFILIQNLVSLIICLIGMIILYRNEIIALLESMCLNDIFIQICDDTHGMPETNRLV